MSCHSLGGYKILDSKDYSSRPYLVQKIKLMNQPLDRGIAKDEIERINDSLEFPHLLIGGLAVQQYCTHRGSKDIDLVCKFEISQSLIRQLYPSLDWDVIELNEDDYRPSFRIIHKSQDKGEIIFGPKITERSSYDYIDWNDLERGARSFKHRSKELKNILVPPPHALAYTKFISFLGRLSNGNKTKQDLEDFVDLTNHRDFSATDLYGLLRRSGNFEELIIDFKGKASDYQDLLRQSCLFHLALLFFIDSGDSLEMQNSGNSEVLEPARRDVMQNIQDGFSQRDESTEFEQVELIIDGSFEDYSVEKQKALMEAIRVLLNAKNDLKIRSKRRGSIKLLLQLSRQEATQLINAFKYGKLDGFDIIDVTSHQDEDLDSHEANKVDLGKVDFYSWLHPERIRDAIEVYDISKQACSNALRISTAVDLEVLSFPEVLSGQSILEKMGLPLEVLLDLGVILQETCASNFLSEVVGYEVSLDGIEAIKTEQYIHLFRRQPLIDNNKMLLTYAEWLLITGFPDSHDFLKAMYPYVMDTIYLTYLTH